MVDLSLKEKNDTTDEGKNEMITVIEEDKFELVYHDIGTWMNTKVDY